MKNVLRAFNYVKPYWALAAASIVIMALSALMAVAYPWPLQLLVDYVLSGRNLPLPAALAFLDTPTRYVLLLVAVAAGLLVVVASNGLAVVENYVNTRLHQRMALDFRADLFRHAQRLSLAYHDQRRIGHVVYLVNYQADSAARVIMTIPRMGQSVLTLVGIVLVTMQIDWQLALLSLLVVPFLYYSVGYYARHIQPRLHQVKSMEGESLSIIHEGMSMLRVIVAFGRERYEHDRFYQQGSQVVDARVNITVRQTLFSLAVNTITGIGTALVLGLGAHHVLRGDLSVGQLLVVMSYVAAVYKPLETISYTIGALQDQLVSLRLAFDLLDTEPTIRNRPGALHIKQAAGGITFENVDFRYTQRETTLSGISFEAKPGQVIAIVGPTGAGKTTLVSLIPRFYDVTGGRILLDGIDVRNLQLASLRKQISFVLQEPLLFRGTIADNIRYGRLDATEAEIIEAAKAANAHDFIMRLPKKYDTQIGERGAQLSGGERQRIAVARAFLKNAPILILDEPTSSIDSRTEAVILDALDRIMAGRTTFMIAHRLSTLRRTDQILVLDGGRLVEHGTREELMAQNGLFRRLVELQMGPPRNGNGAHAQPEAAGAGAWPK